MEQRSKEWHLWRRDGIGSSEAPAIMMDPEYLKWTTPRKVWELKLGLREEDPTNFAMRRGIIWEDSARAAFELEHGGEYPPAVVVNEKYPFVRASLDGWSAPNARILEIKVPGKVAHAQAAAGLVPRKYQWQLVHQMLCTGAEVVDYWSYHPESRTGFHVEFRFCPEKARRLFEAEFQFWELVKSKTWPEKITWLGPLNEETVQGVSA